MKKTLVLPAPDGGNGERWHQNAGIREKDKYRIANSVKRKDN